MQIFYVDVRATEFGPNAPVSPCAADFTIAAEDFNQVVNQAQALISAHFGRPMKLESIMITPRKGYP